MSLDIIMKGSEALGNVSKATIANIGKKHVMWNKGTAANRVYAFDFSVKA